MISFDIGADATSVPPSKPPKNPELWALSQSLESSFLSEMLKSAGLGKVSDEFGGGIGEEQFASFLNQTHADAMVSRGGIGLAESIYRSLDKQGTLNDTNG